MGMGEDLHRLEDGGPLRLGGVDVEGDRHAVGHSDADALLHAVTDAILGALALGDIGQHFSDRAAENRGRDSAEMLRHAVSLAAQHGYRPLQMDSVVHLERPRLSSARDSMRGRLAELLGVSMEAISIKAKTGEGLGEVGRAQAIVCQALVQLGPL
jgi:2-C-methyl-D-erythritol 2,4-cyclodiphosphate synthase